MLPVTASLILIGAAMGAALMLFYCLFSAARVSIARQQSLLEAMIGQRSQELDQQAAELRALIAAARQETQRLETAIRRAESISRSERYDALAEIESLGDPAALADPDQLARTIEQMPQLPSDIPADLFAADHRSLAVTRLADQGLPLAEIARELRLPIGDVELLLSLRTA